MSLCACDLSTLEKEDCELSPVCAIQSDSVSEKQRKTKTAKISLDMCHPRPLPTHSNYLFLILLFNQYAKGCISFLSPTLSQEAGIFCVAPTNLELTLKMKLSLKMQRSTSFCLLSTGVNAFSVPPGSFAFSKQFYLILSTAYSVALCSSTPVFFQLSCHVCFYHPFLHSTFSISIQFHVLRIPTLVCTCVHIQYTKQILSICIKNQHANKKGNMQCLSLSLDSSIFLLMS